MLFVGDDWAEDHHDVEVQDERDAAGQGAAAGGRGRDRAAARADRRVTSVRATPTQVQVLVGIETDRGPWVRGAGRGRVSGVRGQPAAGGPVPRAARMSGAKSDAGDAHVLADMVRTDAHQLRPVAGDSRRPRRSRWSPGRTRR